MAPTRVVLADENELFREGLAKLLKEHNEIEVVSMCSSGEQVVKTVRETEPDVLLIESDIPERNSINITSDIRKTSPDVKVAVLTNEDDREHLAASIKAGVVGYLSKKIQIGDLIKSIDLIKKGQIVVSPPLAAKLASKLTYGKTAIDANESALSDREWEVLRLLCRGHTNKEIASSLFITENTTKVHLKNILQKLQLRNRQQVVAYAVQQGMVNEINDDINPV